MHGVSLTIRTANLSDDSLFARFVAEHVAESGREGSLHFSLSPHVVREDVRANAAVRWARALSEPNWGRAWLLFAPEDAASRMALQPAREVGFRAPQTTRAQEEFARASSRARSIVVGHLELKGGRCSAELHRASLGMGILRPFTRMGFGKQLLEQAIAWAKNEQLAWIDLGVFRYNLPARKLYERMGFVEQGLRADAFRIDGAPEVDDVLMSLDLR